MKYGYLLKTKPGYAAILALGLFMLAMSCQKTEVVDKSGFKIYYSDMTDIGPSMSATITAPSYLGAAPHDFQITTVMVNDSAYTGDNFVIDSAKGRINIRNTDHMPVGVYKLSVSCVSGGKKYEFKDIVRVNMMKPVPDGISVVPGKLEVKLADVLDETKADELPTAQVTVTDSNYVSIKKYEIVKSDFSDYFSISPTGEISIKSGDPSLLPGKYILSLKLSTGAEGEDKGIFPNAVEIDVTSAPLSLVYTPSSGKIEEETILSGQTSFESREPVVVGSADDLAYAISGIEPATGKITIDAVTGVLKVSPDHGFVAGQSFAVSVNVKNKFAPEGVNFERVFTLDVVDFITPIRHFSYEDVDALQAVAFEAAPGPDFEGDEVRFSFVDLPAALTGLLTLDPDGTISAPKGNQIPLGTYTVKVEATNPKSDETHPDVAAFILKVGENPNFFTYVRYGNNLGLTPAENYANQFRIKVGEDFSSVSPVPVTDAKVPLKFSFQDIRQSGGTTIDENTGQIFLGNKIKEGQVGGIMVTATAGEGTPAEFSIETPVFFHNSELIPSNSSGSNEKVAIEYSPFVIRANPRNGAESGVPKITGVDNMSQFTLDYRRSFSYNDFGGNFIDGQPNASGSFLQLLWNQYGESVNKAPNYGARAPMSYFDNKNALDKPLAYIDPSSYKLIVNANKWSAGGVPGDGVMIGQVTFGTRGEDPGSGAQTFPLVIWVSSKF